MKKKIIPLLLAALLILQLCPLFIFGASAEAQLIDISYFAVSKQTDKADINNYPFSQAYDGDPSTAWLGGTPTAKYEFSDGAFVSGETYGALVYYNIADATKVADVDHIRYYANRDNTSKTFTNHAFDVYYTADGTNWTKLKSFSDVCGNGSGTAGSGSTDFVGGGPDSYYYTDIDFTGVSSDITGICFAIIQGRLSEGYTTMREIEVYGELKDVPLERDSDGYIKISSQREFTGIANDLNGKYRLYSDLDMTGYSAVSGTFTGELDGNGKTLTNLSTRLLSLGEGAEVKDLTVGAVDLGTGTTTLFKMAGGTQGITLTNVINKRSIKASGKYGAFATDPTGKITLINCVNEGNITLSGKNNFKMGGFFNAAASGSTITMTGCVNKGAISGSQIGGMIGVISGGCTITMTDCANTAALTAYANSADYGIAGGLIGGYNNAGNIEGNVSITLTGCSNTGNILSESTEDNTKAYGIGGLIGILSASTGTYHFNVLIKNCTVSDCNIAQTGSYSHGAFYGAAFLGKVSPKNASDSVTVANGIVRNVDLDVAADVVDNEGKTTNFARYFLGVGSKADSVVVKAVNCFASNYTEKGSAEWNTAKNSNVSVGNDYDLLADFASNDGADLIANGAYQTADNGSQKDIRFVSTLTLGGETLDDFSKVGFLVMARTAKMGDGLWNVSGTQVLTSLNAGNTTYTPAQITAGADYIFALSVEGIPYTAGEMTFRFLPYVIDGDGNYIFGQVGTTAAFTVAQPDPVKVMAYNVKDGAYLQTTFLNEDYASTRVPDLAENIGDEAPDIVLLSETHLGDKGASAQKLANKLSGYAVVEYDDSDAGNTSLLYKSGKFTMIESGVQFCVQDNSALSSGPRGITWAVLERKSDGQRLLAIACHGPLGTDLFSGYKAPIYQLIKAKGYPVIFGGDMNLDQTRTTLLKISRDDGFINTNTEYTAVLDANKAAGGERKWKDGVLLSEVGVDPTHKDGNVIDWLFVSSDVSPANYRVCTEAGLTASDHYPIVVEITY